MTVSQDTIQSVPENVPSLPSKNNLQWPDSWKHCQPWIIRSTNAQNQFYVANAGRMFNTTENYEIIEAKILTDAFGNVPPRNRSLAAKVNFWYSKIQRKIAISMRKKIQKLSKTEEVYLNVVYVMAYINESNETAFPVFYFKDANDDVRYIDLQSRVYDSWDDFLKNNVMDPSLCCYPKIGHYGQSQESDTPIFDENISLSLEIYESPACGIGQTAIRWAKTGLVYTSYALMGASLIAGTSSAKWLSKFAKLKSFSTKMQLLKPYIDKTQKFYSYVNAASIIAFSMMSAVDKWKHDESIIAEISLVVSTVVSMMTDYINKKIVTTGLGKKDLGTATYKDLTPMTRFFLNMFSLSRCVSSMISIMTVIATMLYKENCTAADYFNLSSSIFTCYGTMTSPLTAKKIFQQLQMEYIMEQMKDATKPIPAKKDATNETATAVVAGYVGLSAGIADTFSKDGNSTMENQKVNEVKVETNETREKNGDNFIKCNENVKKLFSKENITTVIEKADEAYSGISHVYNHLKKASEMKECDISDMKSRQLNIQSPTENSEQQINIRLSDSVNQNDKISGTACISIFEKGKPIPIPPIPIPFPQPPPDPKPRDEQNESSSETDNHLIQLRDDLARRMIRDNNDTAGTAAHEYYWNNFVLAFRGTENEDIMNKQLIRMMVFADDVRSLFCEIALTETTFDIKRGVLLVNGQLNIDGGAFAQTTNKVESDADERLLNKIDCERNGKNYNRDNPYWFASPIKSHREKLMEETKDYDDAEKSLQQKHEAIRNSKDYINANKKQRKRKDIEMANENRNSQTAFLNKVKLFTANHNGGHYRLMFEVQIQDFQTLIKNRLGLNLEDIQIGDLRPFENTTVSDYFRLDQQFRKNPKQEAIQAALTLAEKLNLTNVEGIASCHQILRNEEPADGNENFYQRFNNPQDNVQQNIVKNYRELLDVAEKALEQKPKDGRVRRFDERLMDQNIRTVAAIAVSHAIKDSKEKKDNLQKQKEIVIKSVQSVDIKRENAPRVLSQDGKRWQPLFPKNQQPRFNQTREHTEL